MAVITEINGVSTSGTTGINNIFGSGGGGGVTAPALGNTSGVQVFGTGLDTLNSGLTSAFNRTEVALTQYSGTDFKAIAAKKNYTTCFAVTNDGKLHYATNTNTWMGGATADMAWHEDTSNPTGTSGDWTWVHCDDNSAVAIRGGDVCFRGYGNYRQRGDGTTGSTSSWVKTYDGSTDPAVKCYLGYRIHYMITAAGKMYACGYRYDGMLGDGSTSGQSATFIDITPTGVQAQDICFGYRCAKIIDQNGDVWSWGDNYNQHAGPLITSNADILSPTRSTNTGPFLNGEFISGGSGDMFTIRDSSGNLWVQGEGSGRENPTGSSFDHKNAWYEETTLAGDFARPLMAHGTIGQGDNLGLYVKPDGTVVLTGTDAQLLTASPTSTGTGQSGSAPFDVLGGSQDVYFAAGNVNRFIVVYQA